ncbi:MAG: heat shock protein HspQ [Alphaproteobacteria bacterium]|nr:heat shock protein HspQ [Alphaproteobacteria bacterium]
MSDEISAEFHIGQIVKHQKFGYRGVIFDVDPIFSSSNEWYQAMAKSKPPKDKPWYHVLVHGSTQTTYVAERHLASDNEDAPVSHPLIDQFFSEFKNGQYVLDVVRN